MYIEPPGEATDRRTEPAPGSLEALRQGRRIASALGARLHAFVPVAAGPIAGPAPEPVPAPIPEPGTAPDADAGSGPVAGPGAPALIATLSGHGADQVMLAPVPPGPPLWATHGQALAAACRRLEPRLVLLAATPAGRDLAPRLAARAGAAFVPEPVLEITPGGDVLLTRPAPGAAHRSNLEELDRPCVATLAPGGAAQEPARATDVARIVDMSPETPAELPWEHVNSHEDDPGAALDTARVVVSAGRGVQSAESLSLVAALARALGGELGGTHGLCRTGMVPPHRAIDIGGRRIAPALYVTCAASGSPAHLGAVAPGATIVAINTDAEAPVFRAARHGIVGSVEAVVPALLAALEGRVPTAVRS